MKAIQNNLTESSRIYSTELAHYERASAMNLAFFEFPLMGCTGCFTQQVRLSLFHLQIGEVAWRRQILTS